MRLFEKKKGKDKIAAVLMLCFCVIALTSIFTIKASIDKISQSAGNVPVDKPTAADRDTGKDSAGDKPEEDAKESAAKVPTVDSKKQPPKSNQFVSPMDMSSAEIAKDYSMDMVIYNLTLDQYMTHPGMDIQAPTGSNVKAAASGTVTDVYTDDAYGITIEITHNSGYISRYSNLSTDKLIEKGDSVKQGQVISTIGKSALYESMEKAHLHFEMEKDGKLLNPAKFTA